VSVPDLQFSASRESAGHTYEPTDVPVTLTWNLTTSPSTLTTSAFVTAWTTTSVDPEPGVGGSAIQFREPETESTTTLLTVNALGGCSLIHPSELPPGTLVAVNETSLATPLSTEAGDTLIVQPPLAAFASPGPRMMSASAIELATPRLSREAIPERFVT
jgi:hypothetical protein